MLASYLSPSLIGGGSCIQCVVCGAGREMVEHPTVDVAPEHLTVLLKRFEYDRTSQKARKKLHTVGFEHTLVLPGVPLDFTPEGAPPSPPRTYGLFAVVLHKGATASRLVLIAFVRALFRLLHTTSFCPKPHTAVTTLRSFGTRRRRTLGAVCAVRTIRSIHGRGAMTAK